MSSIAVAALIQRETGLEAVVQITTRDRNVLGLQSDLLGAAGPRPQGDALPRRRPAEDRRLSAGQAGLGGGRARAPPDRQRLERRRRPRRQRDRRTDAPSRSAARPIPPPPDLESRAREAARQDRGRRARSRRPSRSTTWRCSSAFSARDEPRAIPVLVGLIPLRSLKQTLFFANEVPGIVVPGGGPGTDAARRPGAGPTTRRPKGSRIARELAAGIAAIARGHPPHADGPRGPRGGDPPGDPRRPRRRPRRAARRPRPEPTPVRSK